jgi:hypothetical protein
MNYANDQRARVETARAEARSVCQSIPSQSGIHAGAAGWRSALRSPGKRTPPRAAAITRAVIVAQPASWRDAVAQLLQEELADDICARFFGEAGAKAVSAQQTSDDDIFTLGQMLQDLHNKMAAQARLDTAGDRPCAGDADEALTLTAGASLQSLQTERAA